MLFVPRYELMVYNPRFLPVGMETGNLMLGFSSAGMAIYAVLILLRQSLAFVQQAKGFGFCLWN